MVRDRLGDDVGGLLGQEAEARASVTAGSAAATANLPHGIEVLEMLGALDDLQFNPLQLRPVAGLEVFEDATVELPSPVERLRPTP